MTTPPLPEPWREDADGEQHYTIVQVIEYGQACREAALKEAAQAALDAPLKSATQPVREACANAIRRLK